MFMLRVHYWIGVIGVSANPAKNVHFFNVFANEEKCQQFVITRLENIKEYDCAI